MWTFQNFFPLTTIEFMGNRANRWLSFRRSSTLIRTYDSWSNHTAVVPLQAHPQTFVPSTSTTNSMWVRCWKRGRMGFGCLVLRIWGFRLLVARLGIAENRSPRIERNLPKRRIDSVAFPNFLRPYWASDGLKFYKFFHNVNEIP